MSARERVRGSEGKEKGQRGPRAGPPDRLREIPCVYLTPGNTGEREKLFIGGVSQRRGASGGTGRSRHFSLSLFENAYSRPDSCVANRELRGLSWLFNIGRAARIARIRRESERNRPTTFSSLSRPQILTSKKKKEIQ